MLRKLRTTLILFFVIISASGEDNVFVPVTSKEESSVSLNINGHYVYHKTESVLLFFAYYANNLNKIMLVEVVVEDWRWL